MANFFFNLLNAHGITTNPSVGYFCAMFFYCFFYFICAAAIGTYGIKGILRMLEAFALFSCRIMLECLIFIYILFRYRKGNFFVRYEKRRRSVLKNLTRK